MASVFDVAKYILHKQREISTWKLQKLCFRNECEDAIERLKNE